MKLANGEIMTIPYGKDIIKTGRDQEPDKVKDYRHLSLEVGITTLLFGNDKLPKQEENVGPFENNASIKGAQHKGQVSKRNIKNACAAVFCHRAKGCLPDFFMLTSFI